MEHEGKFECDKCDKKYTRRGALKNHMDKVHDIKLPPLTHQSRNSKLKDQDLKNPRKFNCDKCDKSYTEKYNLDNHKKRVHYVTTEPPLGEFKCTLCVKRYARRLGLRRHMKNVHDATLPTLRSGQKSSKGSENEQRFKCDFCSNYYEHKTNLNRHMRKKHNVQYNSLPKRPTRQCKRCGKRFISNTWWFFHAKYFCVPLKPRLVTSKRNFCRKQFQTKEQLLVHKKMARQYSLPSLNSAAHSSTNKDDNP